MANKYKYQIDFGTGYTDVNILDNNLKYVVSREISEFTFISKLEGSFKTQSNNFVNLENIIETNATIDFKILEYISGSWTDLYVGKAHLRGDIDWNNGIIEIFGFSEPDSNISDFLNVWDTEHDVQIIPIDFQVKVTNGTTTYTLAAFAFKFIEGINYLLQFQYASSYLPNITVSYNSLPFDYKKIMCIPTYMLQLSLTNWVKGQYYKISVKDMLYWLEKMFQVYWYIDETISTSSKLIFYYPGDKPIAAIKLDGTYTDFVSADIGKTILDDGASAGILIDYDNTAKIIWVRMTVLDSIADNSVITVSSGTGSATANGDSSTKYFPVANEVDVTSLTTDLQNDKYREEQMYWLENFNFNNEFSSLDFKGFPIRYPVETDKKIDYDLKKVTTNVFEAVDNDTNGISINDEGFALMWCTETATNVFTTDTGTGLISGQTICNEHLSKANLHETYFKTNRYFVRSGIYINDTLTTLASDAYEKNIRTFPDLNIAEDETPTTIGTMIWKTGTTDKIGLVLSASTDLNTATTTYKVRQLKSAV